MRANSSIACTTAHLGVIGVWEIRMISAPQGESGFWEKHAFTCYVCTYPYEGCLSYDDAGLLFFLIGLPPTWNGGLMPHMKLGDFGSA